MQASPQIEDWKTALLRLRTEIGEYARESRRERGDPMARLQECRVALRRVGRERQAEAVALRAALNDIEDAQRRGDQDRIARLAPELLRQVDGMLGSA